MRLTKAQIKVVEQAIHNPIIETLGTDGTKTYRFVDGKNIRSDMFGRLLGIGAIVPQNDALFSGFSQTYIGVK